MKKLIFLILLKSIFGEFHEECVSLEESEKCQADCNTVLVGCLNDCSSDVACSQNCLREQVKCENKCPCFDACPHGCPCEGGNVVTG